MRSRWASAARSQSLVIVLYFNESDVASLGGSSVSVCPLSSTIEMSRAISSTGIIKSGLGFQEQFGRP